MIISCLQWIPQNTFVVLFTQMSVQNLSLHWIFMQINLNINFSTADEDAIDNRWDVARTFRAAVFVSWQGITDFQDQVSKLAFRTWWIVFLILICRNDCIMFVWASPWVWTAAVWMIRRNTTFLDTFTLLQLDAATRQDAIVVLCHWFVLEAFCTNTAVTLVVKWLHSFSFLVSFAFEIAGFQCLCCFT